MKLDKAIEILTTWEEKGYTDTWEGFHEAQKLGIEALKRCQALRAQHLFRDWLLLPGETED